MGVHFRAGSIGGEPLTTGESVERSYRAGWIDIGPEGEFGTMLPITVRDINDLIAHYDQLVQYFANWPDREHKRELLLPSGKRVGYYRERGRCYPKQ